MSIASNIWDWVINMKARDLETGQYIRCTVTGEWSDGSKVWTDEQGRQYIAIRRNGKMWFVLVAED